MANNFFIQYTQVFIFLVLGVLFIAITLFISRLIRPHAPTPEKLSPYECGEVPIGSPWIRFNIRFYIIALIFLIFDVEILLLYPWAVVFKRIGAVAFIEMFLFVFILIVGFVYVWREGYLEWVKPRRE
uniref:NADH dehydrogenase I subunit A n=1 Tax=uncultured prokaryote TaxID=198431 RepID=H5SPA0_9ZZZZ|nr:NADH dehydrogenase I subunit A [uncultured prokaryote]